MRESKFINEEIHLLGLANMAKWHGYDRVIEGLRQYKKNSGNKEVIFHLVGPDGDGSLKEWMTLTRKYKLEKNVIFEGPKFNRELDYFFNKCNLAIGSIGLHRTGYESATTLKVREYMARGIPFLMSASDQAIESDNRFCVIIPADDSPVNIELIIRYVENIRDWEYLSKSMREYANDNMTWEKQFRKIIDKIGDE